MPSAVTRNLTLSMPDELVRQAKVLAAQRDMSVSALVAELLAQVVGDSVSYEQAWADEEALMASGVGMRVGEVSWSRDELHDR